MSDVLSTLLRRGCGDLLSVWAARLGLPSTVPHTEREQARWAALVTPDLALNTPRALAQVRSDADVIPETREPSKDWIFLEVLRHYPAIPPHEIEGRNSDSRALWLRLDELEAHQGCARRAKTFDPFGKPRLLNRFCCQGADDFFRSDPAFGPVMDELKKPYREPVERELRRNCI